MSNSLIQVLKDALEKTPKDEGIRLHLVKLLSEAGDDEEAFAETTANSFE